MKTIQQRGELTSLEYVSAGSAAITIGLLLVDVDRDRLHTRFRTDWTDFDESTVEIVSALTRDLTRARKLSAGALINHLQNTLSHPLRITDRRTITLSDFEIELDRRAQELLPHIAFSSVKGAPLRSRSSIQTLLRTTLHYLRIPKRELIHGVPSRRLLEAGYAVASGACVLAVMFTGVTVTQTDRLTESPQTLREQTFERSSILSSGESSVTSSSLLLNSPDRISAIPLERKAKNRARYARRTEHRVLTQTFILPRKLTSAPEMVVLLPPDAPIHSIGELTPPQFVEPLLTISPPPLERVVGVRRLLHAILYPFKKVGRGLAN